MSGGISRGSPLCINPCIVTVCISLAVVVGVLTLPSI